MTWYLSWTPYALSHGHNLFLSRALESGRQVNLAENTPVVLLGLIGSPVTHFLGPIATMNLLLRIALASSAASAYFVLRRFCRGVTGPFAGGLLYGFSPAIVAHLYGYDHLDLVFVPLLPVLFYLLYELVVDQEKSPWRKGVVFGLVGAAQYLTSAELFADFCVLAVIALLLAGLARRDEVRRRMGYTLTGLGWGVGTFAVVAGYPLYLVLAGPGHLSGPVQATSHLQSFRVDLLELLLPGPAQWLEPGLLSHVVTTMLGPIRHAGGYAEISGYLGIPLVVVTVVLCLRGRRAGLVKLAGAMAAVACLLSLGSVLQVDGHVTGVPLPEAVFQAIPFLDNNVPARFALFTVLFVAVVLALGVDRFLGELAAEPNRTRGLLLVGLGAACCVVTLLPMLPVSSERTVLSSSLKTAVARLVPRGARLLTYPYAEPPYDQAMLWQASDDFAFQIVGGYVTVRSGDGSGEIYPPLQKPSYPQELFASSQTSGFSYYPKAGHPSDPRRLLCTFIRRNKVTAVLYEDYGPGAATVHQLFLQALGRPSRQQAGLSVWVLAGGDCAG